MNANPLKTKSFALAVEITKLSLKLQKDHREYVIARQILRSGTSIGANVEGPQGSQSHADFKQKISIAYKESLEMMYWIRILYEGSTIDYK